MSKLKRIELIIKNVPAKTEIVLDNRVIDEQYVVLEGPHNRLGGKFIQDWITRILAINGQSYYFHSVTPIVAESFVVCMNEDTYGNFLDSIEGLYTIKTHE